MVVTLADIFTFFIKALLGASIVIWLIRYRQLPRALQVLGYFLVFDLMIELAAGYLSARKMNNLPLLHLFTTGEFIFFSFFYYHLIRYLTVHKRYFYLFFGIVITFLLINSAFIQSIYSFNSIAKCTVHLILIVYAIWYFYQLSLHSEEELNKSDRPLRLINSAVLLYYSGTVVSGYKSNIIS